MGPDVAVLSDLRLQEFYRADFKSRAAPDLVQWAADLTDAAANRRKQCAAAQRRLVVDPSDPNLDELLDWVLRPPAHALRAAAPGEYAVGLTVEPILRAFHTGATRQPGWRDTPVATEPFLEYIFDDWRVPGFDAFVARTELPPHSTPALSQTQARSLPLCCLHFPLSHACWRSATACLAGWRAQPGSGLDDAGCECGTMAEVLFDTVTLTNMPTLRMLPRVLMSLDPIAVPLCMAVVHGCTRQTPLMQAPTSLAASDMVPQICDHIVELMQCEDPKDLRAIVKALSAEVTAFPSLRPVYDIGVECIGRKCGDTGLLTPDEAGVCKAVHRALTATRPADGTYTCGRVYVHPLGESLPCLYAP